MTSTAVATFAFDMSPGRVVKIHGRPWFVAPDVCRVLAMPLTKGATQYLQRLSEDEKRPIMPCYRQRG